MVAAAPTSTHCSGDARSAPPSVIMSPRLDCQSILETAGLDFISRFLDSMGEQADQANRMEATLQLEVIARQAAKAQPSAALDEDTVSPPSSPRPLSPWERRRVEPFNKGEFTWGPVHDGAMKQEAMARRTSVIDLLTGENKARAVQAAAATPKPNRSRKDREKAKLDRQSSEMFHFV